jgi:hypothetical protein
MSDVANRRINVVRASAATGLGFAALMILCWIGAFIPFASPTHAYVGLFTPAELHSVRALMEGTLWAFLFGIVAGAIISLIYNSLAALERP